MSDETRYVNVGTVRVFAGVKPDKAQALKPLEEAAEVFDAAPVMLVEHEGGTFECQRPERVTVLDPDRLFSHFTEGE